MDTNLQKYLAFIKTVETGSFTKAAEELSYSQSGISRMISDLEVECGLMLLERGKKGVKLTSDGNKLLPYAKRLCEEYNNFQMQVDALNGLETGLIRIAAFSSVATCWLPNIISRFRQDYPNIDYEISVGEYGYIEELILEGRADCGFLLQPVDDRLESVFLENDRMMAIIPATHPMADAELFPIDEFRREPFLQCREPFMQLKKAGMTDESIVFERNGMKPDPYVSVSDGFAIMSMVEKGLGVGMLPELMLKRVPYDIVAKDLDVPAYRQISFVFRHEKRDSMAIRRFIEYLKYRNE